MANLRFCDKIIANRGKVTIRVPSHMIAITIRELHVLGFLAVMTVMTEASDSPYFSTIPFHNDLCSFWSMVMVKRNFSLAIYLLIYKYSDRSPIERT